MTPPRSVRKVEVDVEGARKIPSASSERPGGFQSDVQNVYLGGLSPEVAAEFADDED